MGSLKIVLPNNVIDKWLALSLGCVAKFTASVTKEDSKASLLIGKTDSHWSLSLLHNIVSESAPLLKDHVQDQLWYITSASEILPADASVEPHCSEYRPTTAEITATTYQYKTEINQKIVRKRKLDISTEREVGENSTGGDLDQSGRCTRSKKALLVRTRSSTRKVTKHKRRHENLVTPTTQETVCVNTPLAAAGQMTVESNVQQNADSSGKDVHVRRRRGNSPSCLYYARCPACDQVVAADQCVSHSCSQHSDNTDVTKWAQRLKSQESLQAPGKLNHSQLQCPFCSHTATKQVLVKHMHAKHSRRANLKDKVKQLQKQHQKLRSRLRTVARCNRIFAGLMYKCKFCDYLAKDLALRSHHELHRCSYNPDVEKVYQCQFCSVMNSSHNWMEKHTAQHLLKGDHMKHMCNLCGHMFSRVYNLTQHQKLVNCWKNAPRNAAHPQRKCVVVIPGNQELVKDTECMENTENIAKSSTNAETVPSKVGHDQLKPHPQAQLKNPCIELDKVIAEVLAGTREMCKVLADSNICMVCERKMTGHRQLATHLHMAHKLSLSDHQEVTQLEDPQLQREGFAKLLQKSKDSMQASIKHCPQCLLPCASQKAMISHLDMYHSADANFEQVLEAVKQRLEEDYGRLPESENESASGNAQTPGGTRLDSGKKVCVVCSEGFHMQGTLKKHVKAFHRLTWPAYCALVTEDSQELAVSVAALFEQRVEKLSQRPPRLRGRPAAEAGEEYDSLLYKLCDLCTEAVATHSYGTHLSNAHPENSDREALTTALNQTLREISYTQLTNNVDLQCPYCSVITKRATVYKHMKSMHRDKADYTSQLKQVMQRFKHELNGQRSAARVKRLQAGLRYKCQYCPSLYQDCPTRSVHEMYKCAHNLNRKAKFRCKICKDSGVSQQWLDTHMHKHDPDGPNYVCDQCGRTYHKKAALRSHRNKDHAMKVNHECNVCGRQFYLLTHYNSHLLSHSKDRSFLCPTCGKGYKSGDALRRHERAVHVHKEEYRCHHCGYTTDKQSAFTTHSGRCLADTNATPDPAHHAPTATGNSVKSTTGPVTLKDLHSHMINIDSLNSGSSTGHFTSGSITEIPGRTTSADIKALAAHIATTTYSAPTATTPFTNPAISTKPPSLVSPTETASLVTNTESPTLLTNTEVPALVNASELPTTVPTTKPPTTAATTTLTLVLPTRCTQSSSSHTGAAGHELISSAANVPGYAPPLVPSNIAAEQRFIIQVPLQFEVARSGTVQPAAVAVQTVQDADADPQSQMYTSIYYDNVLSNYTGFQ